VPAATDPRSELVAWDQGRQGLVIRGTSVPLSALWQSLRDGLTFKEFLRQHPSAPVRPVLRILKEAGRRLSDWPWDYEEEQQVAYARALADNDRRFASGLVRFLPGVRGGKLLSHPSLHRVDILWGYLTHGFGLTEIQAAYPDVGRDEFRQMVEVAGQLFEEGLVPH